MRARAPYRCGELVRHALHVIDHWSTWAYTELVPAIDKLYLASGNGGPAGLKSQAWADHARGTAQDLLATLDGHLGATGFVVANQYSLADLCVSSIVMWGQMAGVATADHPEVSRWLQTCAARPAMKQEWQ